MKKYELLRRTKKLPHNSVKPRSKFYPPKGKKGSEFNPLAFVFLLCLPLSLTGCMGIYEGGFECPAGTGVGCKSISDVNEMVNKGEIPKASSLQLSEEHKPTKLEIWYAPRFRNQETGIRKQEDSSNEWNKTPLLKSEEEKTVDWNV